MNTQRAVLHKKLFYSGYVAGKIGPVLCVAGKMKYISWEPFFSNFLLNVHYRPEAAKFFLELLTIFENLLKLWMFMMKCTKFTHVMQLAGKSISAIFLGVKNTF